MSDFPTELIGNIRYKINSFHRIPKSFVLTDKFEDPREYKFYKMKLVKQSQLVITNIGCSDIFYEHSNENDWLYTTVVNKPGIVVLGTINKKQLYHWISIIRFKIASYLRTLAEGECPGII